MVSKPKTSGNTGRKVVIYTGADPRAGYSSLFFLHLFWRLMTLGREKGVEMIPAIDTRLVNQRTLHPPEVKRAIEKSGVDGIIGIMIYEGMTDWMEETGLPHVGLLNGSAKNRVQIDYQGMVEIALPRLAALGCRSVGMMIPADYANAALLEKMQETAESLNLEVKYEWILTSFKQGLELNGYNQFHSLWKLKNRPDGLVVFPDVTARGVISAIVERCVQVPEELRLVLHRNSETPYMVPFACDWIEISVDGLARMLFKNLEMQWACEPLEKMRMPFELFKGGGPGKNSRKLT